MPVFDFLSLADHPLTLPTPELQAWVDANLTTEEYCPWLQRTWPGYDFLRLAQSQGTEPPQRIELGVYHYPTWGLARHGYGHFLATELQAQNICCDAFGVAGDEMNEIPLKIRAPGNIFTANVETPVYLLPPRPLAKVLNGNDADGINATNWNGLYLLTVVDDRFYLWLTEALLQVIPNEATWKDLFINFLVTTHLPLVGGAEPDQVPWVDIIDRRYLLPHETIWAPGFLAAPLIGDALALNTGLRWVREFDGTYNLVNPVDANRAMLNFLNIHQDGTLDPPHTIRAGGEIAMGPFGSSGGECFSYKDSEQFGTAAYLPNFVTVEFDASAWDMSQVHYAFEVDVSTGHDAVGDAYVVFPDTSFLASDTAMATFSGSGQDAQGNPVPPSNLPALRELAGRLTDDFIGWRWRPFDYMFNGIVAPTPSGVENMIVWTVTSWACHTRYYTQPWMFVEPVQYNHRIPNQPTDPTFALATTPITAKAGAVYGLGTANTVRMVADSNNLPSDGGGIAIRVFNPWNVSVGNGKRMFIQRIQGIWMLINAEC